MSATGAKRLCGGQNSSKGERIRRRPRRGPIRGRDRELQVRGAVEVCYVCIHNVKVERFDSAVL